jgi:hypothetical protein
MTSLLAQAAVVFVAFAEPGFPALDTRQPPPDVPGAVLVTSTAALDSLLREPGTVLVWRHGSAFPLESWPAIDRFLRGGGRLLHLGGEPFTRPVSGPPGGRTVDPRTVTYLKALRLNQSHATPVGAGRLRFTGLLDGLAARVLPVGTTAWTFEPKLAGPPRFPADEGSPGRRDGTVRPLAFVDAEGGDPRFPAAAGALVLEWTDGPFAGGRWILRPLDAPPAADELALLMEEMQRPAARLTVTPVLGTFHEGERPAVVVRWDGPPVEPDVRLVVRDTAGRTVARGTVASGADSVATVTFDTQMGPGLYRVEARAEGAPPAVTGFWVFDPVLFASGDALTFDGYTMRRNGRPEPVVGTTVMSRTVHRDFLHEPDAAIWDDTFAELAALDLNFVRTGVWAGWEPLLVTPDSVDEAWLRALEAYYLSARRHGVPVLFTFFAFMPPAYGGESPYFDPRSLAGQQAWVGAVARRFAPAREMLWDLINEPSIASPRHVWQTRPNGDRWEAEAFEGWLRRTYGGDGSDGADTAWKEVVRRRWRLRPDEPIGVPVEADFADANIFVDRRPYRARDYIGFSQEAFRGWAAGLVRTIREAGSIAAVTVGQDEGGLYDRPSPASHAGAVDFTSIHTWWFNDALTWDALLARAPGKPLLASETGIMRRERLSGEAHRTPEASAALLSRKLAAAFAGGAFGAVEWVYDVNPYMGSDNEVAIGLRRPDGSYKPEHAVLRRWAAFVRRTRERFDTPRESEVLVVAPAAEHWAPRPLGALATRRAAATFLALGVPVRVVRDLDFPSLTDPYRLIVLPATTGLPDAAWRALDSAVTAGATLLASGWFEQDDAGLPAYRLGLTPRAMGLVERLDAQWLDPGLSLEYPLDVAQSALAAGGAPVIASRGAGRLLHYPSPLEWAMTGAALERVYAHALVQADVAPPAVRPARPEPGIEVSVTAFRSATLVVVMNTQGHDREVALTAPGGASLTVRMPAGAGTMFWVSAEGDVLDAVEPGQVVVRRETGSGTGAHFTFHAPTTSPAAPSA